MNKVENDASIQDNQETIAALDLNNVIAVSAIHIEIESLPEPIIFRKPKRYIFFYYIIAIIYAVISIGVVFAALIWLALTPNASKTFNNSDFANILIFSFLPVIMSLFAIFLRYRARKSSKNNHVRVVEEQLSNPANRSVWAK